MSGNIICRVHEPSDMYGALPAVEHTHLTYTYTPTHRPCYAVPPSHTHTQAQQDAATRISDLTSTLEVCQADADNLRDLLAQAELQRRELERQAAINVAAGGQHR